MIIRVVFGAAGAGGLGITLAHGVSAAEYVCRGSLRVLVIPASSSVSFYP